MRYVNDPGVDDVRCRWTSGSLAIRPRWSVGAKLMRWPKKPQLEISMRLHFLGRSTLTEVHGFLKLKLLTLCRAPRMHREQILIFLIVFSTSHL